MPTTICTVWTDRPVPPRGIVKRHCMLEGEISEFVWVNNGGGEVLGRSLAKLCRIFRPRARVVLIDVHHLLPIARAWNVALDRASRDHPDDDYLEAQDDVRVRPGLLTALRTSEFDLAGAWHDDQPPRAFEHCGYPYVVGMAVLIRNRVFRRLGHHDELFIKGVDAEYGVSVGHVYDPLVRHMGTTTALGSNGFARRLHEHASVLIPYLLDRGLMFGRRERRILPRKRFRARVIWPPEEVAYG